MKDVFRFKEFSVNQSGCAMRINTDGVLLGAYAHLPTKHVRVLDIGTGTGVIALMLAQRFPNAVIDGVEIDLQAGSIANENFKASKFSNRLKVFKSSFQDLQEGVVYDWVVSNPPYHLHSLKNHDDRKSQARHSDILFFQELFQKAARLLGDHGCLQLVLPSMISASLEEIAKKEGFFRQEVLWIRSFDESPVIREIVKWGKQQVERIKEEEFIIYESKGQYSRQYKELLAPFFLAF